MSITFSDTSTAKWLADRNLAIIFKASDLTDEHVGKGLLHELWRDHTWDYISRISKATDGKVEIEHLEVDTTENNKNTRNTEVKIVEHRVKKVVQTFDPDDEICLDVNPHVKPQSTRVTTTKTTVVTQEPIDDEATT